MPGPLSSPVGSVTFRTVVPLVTLLVTEVCAYPVRLPDAVADTVSTLSPKPTGTVTENDPSDAATAVPVVDGVPVVVSRDSTTTFAPATVVPVTAVAGGGSGQRHRDRARRRVRHIPLGGHRRGLQCVPGPDGQDEPGLLGLRPGQRGCRARGLAVGEADRRGRRVTAERRGGQVRVFPRLLGNEAHPGRELRHGFQQG